MIALTIWMSPGWVSAFRGCHFHTATNDALSSNYPSSLGFVDRPCECRQCEVPAKIQQKTNNQIKYENIDADLLFTYGQELSNRQQIGRLIPKHVEQHIVHVAGFIIALTKIRRRSRRNFHMRSHFFRCLFNETDRGLVFRTECFLAQLIFRIRLLDVVN